MNSVRAQNPLPKPACGQLLDDRGIRYKQQETIIYAGHTYRVDFLLHTTSLHGRPVILEVDGNVKYNAKEDLVREKARQDRLLHAGYAVVRVSAKDAIYRPRQALQVLRAAGVPQI